MRLAPLPLFAVAAWAALLPAAAPPKYRPPPPEAGHPRLDVAEALADSLRLPDEQAARTRYLSLRALRGLPPKDQALYAATLSHVVNSLSSEAVLEPPRRVGPDLLALDVGHYGGRFARVWERLAGFDPYYHFEVEVRRKKPRRRKPGAARRRKAVKKAFALAPWLDAKEAAALAARTQSAAPVVRADWFFKTVGVNADRGNVGYYSWLGVKKRADVERLAGFDRDEARRLKREIAAVVTRSGVAQNNRAVVRFGAVDAGYWTTLDVFDNSTKRRNAVRNLDADLEHQAEEVYFVTANRLFGYYLSDADGVQQDSAPDRIGPDTTSTSNDGRIHVFLSCVRCHKEGLRPVDDYMRRTYRSPLALQAVRHKDFLRLKQLYLEPLDDYLEDDRRVYARATFRVCGLKVEEVAGAYTRLWKFANDTPVTLAQACRELGVPEKYFVGVLRRLALPPGKGGVAGGLDPVLAVFLQDPPGAIIRDMWEEAYPLAQTYAKGYVPKLDPRKKGR